MDAFYASVEQRDNPALKEKPVIVGGLPNSRGVVSACSYEARRFGVHSAMPSAKACQLCPHAFFLKPRFDAYQEISLEIRDIFYRFTDLVEPLSLDEAYLDVTQNRENIPSATQIAKMIKQLILDKTKLTASAGVSFNKFLAKVASDYNKPDGITVIPPEKAAIFIDRLPIGRFYGIGKVTEKKMKSMGIYTGEDLKKMKKEDLNRIFGKAGAYYYDIAHGLDYRPVVSQRIRKSVGKETTFEKDICDIHRMTEILRDLSAQVEHSLKKHRMQGKTVTLKVKSHDFKLITRSKTLPYYIGCQNDIFRTALELLPFTETGKKYVRLLGISVSNIMENSGNCIAFRQLPLPFVVHPEV